MQFQQTNYAVPDRITGLREALNVHMASEAVRCSDTVVVSLRYFLFSMCEELYLLIENNQMYTSKD